MEMSDLTDGSVAVVLESTAETAKDRALKNRKPDGVQPVQIQGVSPSKHWVPSRFNARAEADDGTLILYNSYSGSFSGFPARTRDDVEQRLHKNGFYGPQQGLTKYMVDRGFLLSRGTDELGRVRLRYGTHQYRNDKLELTLLTSEECNFRCVYCYETFPRGTMEPRVRRALIELVKNRAPNINRLNISYFGGEPLLGFEAIEEIAPEFVRLCEENKVRLGSGMTTNAYLLTPSVFAKLLEWKINSFQITLDGAPEDHDAHRKLKDGGGSFHTILSNLNEMRRFPDMFDVAIRVNFDRTNVPRMPEFLELMKDFRDDRRFKLRFYPIGTWGGPNDAELEVCGLSGEQSRQQLDVLASDLGFPTESRFDYLQPRPNNVCYAARPYHLIVGADGKIMKCTIVLDTQDYNIVGRITDDGRTELDVDKMTKWVTPYFEDDEVCKSCFFVPVCQGCSCPLPRITTGERPCPPPKLEIRNTLVSIWKGNHKLGNTFNLSTGALTTKPEPAAHAVLK